MSGDQELGKMVFVWCEGLEDAYKVLSPVRVSIATIE